ncbi:MAG: hypothetical protein DYG98_17410 [Haliscomenobacteraceae bacterium CHB4]|nr:hypothetical protein [Haliscomenobacteraceae bacterium CHB4]
MADTCDFPFVRLAPVIHYAQGPAAYVTFTENVGDIRLKRTDEVSFSTIAVAGQEKLFQGLVSNKIYEIQVLNRCGQYVVAGTIDTKTDVQENPILVSPELYEAIRDFQNQSETANTPLGQFLEGRQDVAFFEKIYFIQRYFLNDQPISAFSPTELPDFMPPTICNCKFVFNILQNAVPGEIVNGEVIPRKEFQPKKRLNGNDNTAFWWNRNTKGAAKWHVLLTEGSKAGGTTHTWQMRMADSTATSGTHYGHLRYNLFCTNYQELPGDCSCNKPLWLYWRYDTEVCAHAEKHPEGWGSKAAVSAAEDVAVAVIRRDGNNIPVVPGGGGRVIRATSECEQTVNSQFWANAATVAINITAVAFGLAAGESPSPAEQQLFNLGLNGLTNSITELINTPYYSANYCENTNCREENACMGDTLVYMQANQPINLYLFSNSSLLAGGKRSWFSWSRTLSDFYLVGYVPGGYSAQEEPYCCSKKYANWVLGSESGPHTTDELKGEVGVILGAWAPWPLPLDPWTGAVQIPYEIHSMAVPVVECPNGGGFHGGGDDRNALQDGNESVPPNTYRLLVFDASGRLLLQTGQENLPTDFRQYLREIMPFAASGIYLVQALSPSDKKSFKVFLD